MIWRLNEIVLFIGSLALFLFVIEVSFRLGRRVKSPFDNDSKAHIGALQAAALVILALLLGFAFAMAESRFEERKGLVIEEANAIGTTFLRSRFLPELERQEMAALLQKYVSARLAFYGAGINAEALDAANHEASQLVKQMWMVTSEIAAKEAHSLPVGLFIGSLNEVLDDNERRLAALQNHVPDTVTFLLFFVSIVALGFVAFGCGRSGQRRFAMNALFALLLAVVITVILDLDRPRRGFIRVNQDSMMRLKAAMDSTHD
jgi:ABC-type arginine transport system permease subunit